MEIHNGRVLEGDNLILMQELINEGVEVDLIYVDPPYGIKIDEKFGMPSWNSLNEPKNRVDEIINIELLCSKGECNYLRWLYPRLVLMRKLLSERGSIYLHIDWHVGHYVKLMMDDIFGKDNFQNEIIWHYKNSALKAKSKKFRQNTDNIYYYAKNKGGHIWNDIFVKCEPYEASKHKFNPVTKKAERLRNENGKIDYFIVDKKKQDNLFQINALNSAENTKYDTQKPKELIEKFIKASSNEGDLVADFYLGSGTTAEVCKDLNRNFIGCDINPRAVELSKVRCGVFS